MEAVDLGEAPEMIDENDDRVSEWDYFIGKVKEIGTQVSYAQRCVFRNLVTSLYTEKRL